VVRVYWTVRVTPEGTHTSYCGIVICCIFLFYCSLITFFLATLSNIKYHTYINILVLSGGFYFYRGLIWEII